MTIGRAHLNLNTSFRRFSSLGIQASHRPLLECLDEIAILLPRGRQRVVRRTEVLSPLRRTALPKNLIPGSSHLQIPLRQFLREEYPRFK